MSSGPAERRREEQLPPSGAWRPGDHPGRRRFLTLPAGRPFHLEGGGSLAEVVSAYETWGTLDESASNAVLVCHALTGDSHAAGRLEDGHPTPGWWDDLIGPGKPLDTDHLFVVCCNVLGGCQGTTGPSSLDPATGRPYGSSFPVVSIRDMVRLQARVADSLGVSRWLSVVGGSMGGMQVLEWGVMYPHRVRSLVVMSSTAAASAWQIAFSHVGRRAVLADPNFCGGDYYERPVGQGPHEGLSIARSVAQITYRSDEVFSERFDRTLIDPLDGFRLDQRFNVEGYLEYHGTKLARRFDANSYLHLNKAMDLHDIGRGRGGIARALRRVVVPSLIFSISSDTLYPPEQQRRLHEALVANGLESELVTVESPHGHDGFLLETARIGPRLAEMLDDLYKQPDDPFDQGSVR